MDATALIVTALAAWRVAYLVTREDGPWAVLHRLRTRWPLGGLLNCVYCASVWTGAIAVGLWHTPLQIGLWALAASALGLMLASYTGAGRGGS